MYSATLVQQKARGPKLQSYMEIQYTVRKRLIIFLSPAGMSLTKLSLDGNNLIFPGQEEFGKGHPGWGRENR
jgi:hypothetical protein